jgi:hypothetical protein
VRSALTVTITSSDVGAQLDMPWSPIAAKAQLSQLTTGARHRQRCMRRQAWASGSASRRALLRKYARLELLVRDSLWFGGVQGWLSPRTYNGRARSPITQAWRAPMSVSFNFRTHKRSTTRRRTRCHGTWVTMGRKFLINPGRYVDTADLVHSGQVVFWGEWEPPSLVVRRWPRDGQLPRVLHWPYWTRTTPAGARENTDPWVFGDQMLYSNCRQRTDKGRSPTSMQRLAPGSVICFGSKIDTEFCVDTFFVVASAQPWTAATGRNIDVDDAFIICSAEAITTCGFDIHMRFTLYRGATYDTPVHDMYSFVPARPAHHPQPRFSRPSIHLPGLINPASFRGPSDAGRPLPIAEVRNSWAALREQVLAADLVLATHLTTPLETSVPNPVLQSR